jgi:SAM-dependent methyltransferase
MLGERERFLLDRLLRNEVDMAFRRRVQILLDYLELRGGERVLDCGCGMGFHLMAMGTVWDGLQLVGLDSDPERLKWAEREGVPADLVHGDVERLPFDDESFDKVLMSEVLEHLRDDRQALREVHRVLRPGGVLAVSVPHARYPFWWDPINAVWARIGARPIRQGPIVGIWTNHERLYEPEYVGHLAREAGFEVEALEEATHYCVPFNHFLVYGVGKPLFERGLLPGRLRRSADRFSGLENAGTLLDPFNALRAVLRAVDRLNDDGHSGKRTFVNVLLKGRRQGRP